MRTNRNEIGRRVKNCKVSNVAWYNHFNLQALQVYKNECGNQTVDAIMKVLMSWLVVIEYEW